jgi:hypothetical protein
MTLKFSLFSFILEIRIDESIKRTFSVISFMRNDHTVQKVTAKEVSYDCFSMVVAYG